MFSRNLSGNGNSKDVTGGDKSSAVDANINPNDQPQAIQTAPTSATAKINVPVSQPQKVIPKKSPRLPRKLTNVAAKLNGGRSGVPIGVALPAPVSVVPGETFNYETNAVKEVPIIKSVTKATDLELTGKIEQDNFQKNPAEIPADGTLSAVDSAANNSLPTQAESVPVTEPVKESKTGDRKFQPKNWLRGNKNSKANDSGGTNDKGSPASQPPAANSNNNPTKEAPENEKKDSETKEPKANESSPDLETNVLDNSEVNPEEGEDGQSSPEVKTPGSKSSGATIKNVKGKDAVKDRGTPTAGSGGTPSVNGSPNTVQRVLILCQKGEWPAVELALRAIEKAAAAAGVSQASFVGIADEETGYTPLMYAVKENKVAIAEKLLEMNCSLNDKAKDNMSCIHLASLYAKEEMLKLFQARKATANITGGPKDQLPIHMVCSRTSGSSVSLLQLLLRMCNKECRVQPDKDGNIPLFLAIEAGNLGMCKELLSQMGDAQVRIKKANGETALHLATRRHDIDLVKMFVDYGANVDAQNEDGYTPLHIAAINGDENLIKCLFVVKANPNIPDKLDRTPLHIATERGETGIVELLAEKFKASVHERTKDGSTLLHIASLCGHPETALTFLKKGVPLRMPNKAGARCIHTAAQRGHVAVVLALLQKGEDVDAKTNDDFTALHIAVEACKPQVVELLLGYGAQVDLKGGKNKETPLHIAARIEGGEKCAEMLIKSGAQVNATGENGESAFHIAARHGNLNCINLLLESGAIATSQAKSGESGLHVAVLNCHYPMVNEIMKFLQMTSPDYARTLITLQNKLGESPLHYAAKITKNKVHRPDEDKLIVKILMEHGGNIDLLTESMKENALHYCARSGNAEVIQEMCSHIPPTLLQATVNRQSKNGWSPLLVASDCGHLEIVKILLQNQARVDVFDEIGKAALHLAAERGHKDVVDELLRNQAFVNARSKVGITPLHLAAMNGYTELVKSLLKNHGAILDATTLNKQTPLHMAAEKGQLDVCNCLLELKADPNAVDQQGQTPLHLAAENDHSDVVKLFLKYRPELVTMANTGGSTCAHIAAMKGSVEVIKELMKSNKAVVINGRLKATESLPIHLAAEGGHADVVKILLEAGASGTDENKEGHTPLHLAGKFGHVNVLEVLRSSVSLRISSKKTGLTALHVAAYHGQPDFVREITSAVPASLKSDPPGSSGADTYFKEMGPDSGLTPLHLAAQCGHESVVRLLLNFPSVQADAASTVNGIIPLHMAAQGGHTAVVGLLLSKSADQLYIKDKKGRTGLHLASANGHYDMVAQLLGSGADINAQDENGWTSLHYTAKDGNLNVVKLLVESGASTKSETKDGKIPICFAVTAGHLDVMSYLLTKEFSVDLLMEDKKFLFDLMISGKTNSNKPIEEFVLASPTSLDTAAKLGRQFLILSNKEKDRAKDLESASKFCEMMATELMAIGASMCGAGVILRAVDNKGTHFADVLIENEQKEVVAHSCVQKYVTEIWMGNLNWAPWRFVVLFFVFLFVPPVWVAFCLPLGHRYNKIPVIKFMCYLASHGFFMALLTISVAIPVYPIYTSLNMVPRWYEWIVVAWLSGMLLSELTNPGDRAGLGFLKIIIIVISAFAIALHACGIFVSSEEDRKLVLYFRNQLMAISLLVSFVLILDFLTLHHLFGPWAIIIRNLMQDLGRFLVILAIFVIGFTFNVCAVYQPIHRPTPQTKNHTGCPTDDVRAYFSPLDCFEMLFNALFGHTDPATLPKALLGPPLAETVMKVVLGIYLMVTVIVLINLLIAMMSDTYQRIQAQSDLEWKFGRAKLIHNMSKTSSTPSPINLLTEWIFYLYALCKYKGDMWTALSHQQMKPDDGGGEEAGQRRSVDIKLPFGKAAAATKGGKRPFLRKWKRGSSRVAPAGDAFYNTVRRLSTRSLGPTKLEKVLEWQVVNHKYLVLTGKVSSETGEASEET
ncbi:hypothetical protein CHUAL_002089 [Chamberlinius hualienensis]